MRTNVMTIMVVASNSAIIKTVTTTAVVNKAT